MSADISLLLLNTLETVEIETPAFVATSLIVIFSNAFRLHYLRNRFRVFMFHIVTYIVSIRNIFFKTDSFFVIFIKLSRLIFDKIHNYPVLFLNRFRSQKTPFIKNGIFIITKRTGTYQT